ncbi:MAG: hypothetical protein LJE85_10000 [Gammaproteobacteria bacterium]|nr:hypothetical protein [Gammaproteobacteria bacterium]
MKIHAVVFIAIIGFTACSQQPAPRITSQPQPRPQPSHWYDSTYLEYYDAYGPVRMIKDSERKLVFNRNGRLLSQLTQDSGGDFEVRYHYHGDGRLDHITSYRNGAEYRLSDYEYNDNIELQTVRYLDYASGQQFHSRHKIQLLANGGWFSIDIPVERIELPLYKQFDAQGQLVWSSKSDFNHGVGRHFNLSVGDMVISSQVIHENTVQMAGVGGYGYKYDDQGRLGKVTSYSDNDNKAYHTTTYSYSTQGLLAGELKVYMGKSLFNDSLDSNRSPRQEVNYRYFKIDPYGNWTRREVTVRQDGKTERFQQQFRQRRRLEYFEQ